MEMEGGSREGGHQFVMAGSLLGKSGKLVVNSVNGIRDVEINNTFSCLM